MGLSEEQLDTLEWVKKFMNRYEKKHKISSDIQIKELETKRIEEIMKDLEFCVR